MKTRCPGSIPSARLLRCETHLSREIDEAFLKAGSEMYKKQGPQYLQRLLSLQKKEPSE